MDIVIDDIIKPENRSILMNPANKYSSVSVCTNNFNMNVAIQNFASSVTANNVGEAQIAKFMTAGDINDECAVEANAQTEEKQRLQVLLAQLMTAQANTRDLRKNSDIDIKVQATMLAIRMIDESFEQIQLEAVKR